MSKMLIQEDINGAVDPESNSVTSMPRRTTAGSKDILLPKEFVPGQNSVICGRGKVCSSAPGNRRLKKILDAYLKPYSECKSKLEKSSIVSTIVNMVKQSSPVGAFVKFEKGLWYEVEDSVAREKIGCMFRDALPSQYRSSTKAKLARRRACKEAEMFQNVNPSNATWFAGDHQSGSSLIGSGQATLREHRHSIGSSGQSCSLQYNDNNDIYRRFGAQQEETMSSQITMKSLHGDSSFTETPNFFGSVPHNGKQQQNFMPPTGQQGAELSMPSAVNDLRRGSLSHPRSNSLRDLLPIASHLEIMGLSASSKNNIDSLLDQGFDIISSPPSIMPTNLVTANLNLIRNDRNVTNAAGNSASTTDNTCLPSCMVPNALGHPNGADDLPDDISGIFDDT